MSLVHLENWIYAKNYYTPEFQSAKWRKYALLIMWKNNAKRKQFL